MVVKDNVRQRRQDKIKKLMEHQKHQPSESRVMQLHGSATMDEQIYPQTPYPYDKRLEDPEFVWKQQHASRWNSSYLGGGQEPTNMWTAPPTRNLIRIKLLISAVLFGLIWGMFHLEHPWAQKGQQYVVLALTHDLQFNKIAGWYERKFDGAPSFIPTFHFIQDIKDKINKKPSLYAPVLGKVTQPYTSQGVLVETQADAPVSAFDQGRVIFAGQTNTTGMTVIIQHADSRQSFYGWLDNVKVQKNDWVKGGQQIGTVIKQTDDQKGKLYYAIKQNNEYINPADVISFD